MHLLLVEDDERLARALTRLLEEDRHVVEHAPDGRTGLELATGDRRARRRDPRHRAAGHVGPRRGPPASAATGVDVTHPHAHRPRHGQRPRGGPRRRRRRLRRQAVRVPGGRPRACGRWPGGPSRDPRRAEPRLERGAIVLDEAARRVTVNGAHRGPLARASSRCSRRCCATPGQVAHPRPAARPRLAVQRRGDAQRRGRLRPLPAHQAGRGGRADRDRPRRGLPAGRRRWLTASRVDPRDDDAEQTALAGEARLIRRTRWRLVLWSGVSTLVVLLVLGAALYAAVAEHARRRRRGAARSARGPRGRPRSSGQTDPDSGAGTDAPSSPSGSSPGAATPSCSPSTPAGNQVQLGRQPTVVLDRHARARRPRRGPRGARRHATSARWTSTLGSSGVPGAPADPARRLPGRRPDVLPAGAPGPLDRGRDAQRRC